jgi:transposase-like protein
MTLADQAAIPGHDGQVTSGKPGKPKRRTFTAAYKARILAEFDALPENSPERGALLRKERLWHSHIEDWRRQRGAGSLAPGGKKEKNPKDADSAELARLRAENRKLQAQNEKLARDLGKTKTALDIAGKAFALLEEISNSADSDAN